MKAVKKIKSVIPNKRFFSASSSAGWYDTIDKHSLYSWGAKDFLLERSMQIVKGEGVYFYNDSGHKIIDMSAQAVCSNLGHTPPKRVVDALKQQAETMPFMFGDTLVSDQRVKFSKKMSEYAPGDINAFLFLSSGAEANEQAIRIAQRVTGRQKVFSAYRAYHGGTTAALNLTGDPRRHFAFQVPGVVKFHDPLPYTFSWGDTDEEVTERALGALRSQMLHENPTNIAAIILESLIGTNGFIQYPKGYMEGVRALCDEFGILMICDEVMTGFGRTGKRFGFQNYDILPDIISMAKGLTSGWMPLSGIGVRDHVHEKIRSIPLGGGSTYVAHPMSLAVANEVVDIVDQPEFLAHVNAMGKVMKEHMDHLTKKHECVKEGRTVGLFGALEFSDSKTSHGYRGTPQVPDPEMQNFRRKCVNNGVFTFSAGPHITITPPLIITAEQIAEGMEIIDKTITEMKW